MGRSRMFGDDKPKDARTPSPRTTIVGGQPPGEEQKLPPVPIGLERLLRPLRREQAPGAGCRRCHRHGR